jgi:hypothetical protein
VMRVLEPVDDDIPDPGIAFDGCVPRGEAHSTTSGETFHDKARLIVANVTEMATNALVCAVTLIRIPHRSEVTCMHVAKSVRNETTPDSPAISR